MKATNRCPKCDKSEIIRDAFALDRAHGDRGTELTVATFGKPEALIFKHMKSTSLSAWVCASCGFVEFYADNPRNLRVESH